MRRSALFGAITALQLLILVGFGWYGRSATAREDHEHLPTKQNLVATLQLTDLSIWTEARYTRHPSQADFFSPFQDFPSSFEHFPAGSILAPAGTTAAAER
jgi:hypothetical protein